MVIITGYTDAIGGARANQRLSLRRAQVVLRALRLHLAQAGLANVTMELADFEAAPLGPHDVVLAANALAPRTANNSRLDRITLIPRTSFSL